MVMAILVTLAVTNHTNLLDIPPPSVSKVAQGTQIAERTGRVIQGVDKL